MDLYRMIDDDGKYTYYGDMPEFCYVSPVDPEFRQQYVTDCWIVNKRGRVHPGYSASPSAILVSQIGPRRSKFSSK